MNIKKLCVVLAVASTFAWGTAIAQESTDASASEGSTTERQRPDREQQGQRQRRENMTDEQRAAARERWQGMSDAERQAVKDKRGARGKGGKRTPKPATDSA